MSGFRTLGFLLFAPFVIGALTIGVFGFGSYNILIVPMILLGEALLVLAGIIDVEEKEERKSDVDVTDDSTKNG